MHSSPTSDIDALTTTALALRDVARSTGQRRAILLEGGRDWAQHTARAIADALGTASGPDCWISDRIDGALPPGKAVTLLGGECGLLVYDAWSGLDADAIGAATGTLRGGGILLMLAPLLTDWPRLSDPTARRIAVYPFRAADVGGRFVRRFARILAASPAVLRIAQSGPESRVPVLPAIAPPGEEAPAPRGPGPGVAATPDQQMAIDAICHTARGRARRPLVLTSNRGRGKSSALGLAAARLIAEDGLEILVTAPRRGAVGALFEHATQAPAAADTASAPRFLPPDRLQRERPRADLLLVDEAAGIPAPLLEWLLTRYPRVCFATTVHGYEGTGRGFEVRFRAVLEHHTPGWRQVQLETPIRWAPDDPLEALTNRALMLDAEPVADIAVAHANVQTLGFAELDRDRLGTNDRLLQAVFGLLILGHYQTRPADLRHLLDGPNIRVFALLDQDRVVATALTAAEGGFDAVLSEQVFDGLRRPHGHLLPQTLSAHAGLFDATRLRIARIVRIAVHPALRRRRLGRQLIRGLHRQADRDGLDAIGASFGATPALLAFWLSCGLPAVHLGSRRNAASGGYAAVVLAGLNGPGRELAERARRRLAERLPVLLAGPLRRLDPDIAASLLASGPIPAAPFTPEELRELSSFAKGSRAPESALPILARLAPGAIAEALRAGALDAAQARAFIALVLQHRDWTASAELVGTTGRAQALSLLREAVRCICDASAPSGGPG